MEPEPLTPADRLFAGILSALLMLVTAVLLPIALSFFFRRHGLWTLEMYASFRFWAFCACVVAAIIGAKLGTERTISLFGHLWGTEQPRDPFLTLQLRLGLAGIGFVGSLFSGAIF